MSAELSRAPGFALVVWSAPIKAWACVAVSERRELIDGLALRFLRYVPCVHHVLECASVFDDDVVSASLNLVEPDAASVVDVEAGLGCENPDFEIDR